MTLIKSIRTIVRDVAPHWVGDGFPVRSLFSYHEGNDFDPFLLLDYAGPYVFAPARTSRGVGEHPHRGFETVTLAYQGELEHRDSSGSRGSIGPGDVQWMTAGSGVVHEEFHSERFARDGGALELIRLWVNLPVKEKMSPPRYQSILDSQIPRAMLSDGSGVVRAIVGEFRGVRGPAATFTPINVWDIQWSAKGEADLSFPQGHTVVLIVQAGAVHVSGHPLKAGELALFDRSGDTCLLQAESAARVLVLSGQPLNEPVVGHGPFVMNTREQIHQAIHDFQTGRMGRLN
jgi:hypothetical protein